MACGRRGLPLVSLCAAMSSSLMLFACVRPACAAGGPHALARPALHSTAARVASGAHRRAGFVQQLPLGLQSLQRWSRGAAGTALAGQRAPGSRRGLAVGGGGIGGDGGHDAEKMALRMLWKIRAAADDDATSLKAATTSMTEESNDALPGEEEEQAEPSSLLPASAYDNLPALPNNIGQQQSRDYKTNEEDYVFEGSKVRTQLPGFSRLLSDLDRLPGILCSPTGSSDRQLIWTTRQLLQTTRQSA